MANQTESRQTKLPAKRFFLPYREDLPLDPRYPYDVSKAATDMIARSYWHAFGLPVAVTRFASSGDIDSGSSSSSRSSSSIGTRSTMKPSD